MRKIFILFIILGIFTFFFSSTDSDEDCGCFEWKYSKGKIINTYVSTNQRIDNNGTKYLTFRPNIIYEYIVDGIKYTGQNFEQYKTSSTEKHIVENYLKNYSINKIINIKYDINWPENSVMVDGLEHLNKLFTIISVLLIILGAGGLLLLEYRRKRKFNIKNDKCRHST